MSRTLLLLHGGGVAAWMWQPLIHELGDEFRVIAPDLPGHGARRSERYLDHGVVAADLAATLDDAAGPIVPVGFSLGAQLALQFAVDFPDRTDGVVAISAQTLAAPWPRLTLAMLRWAAPLARREWFARAQAKELGIPEALMPDYLAESFAVDADGLVATVATNLAFRVPAAWPSYDRPALVLTGGREAGLVRRSAAALVAARPATARHSLAEAKHTLPLTHPAWVADRIRELFGDAAGEDAAPAGASRH